MEGGSVCHPQKVFFKVLQTMYFKGLKVSVAGASFSILSQLCVHQISCITIDNHLFWDNFVFFPVFFIKLQEFKNLFQQWFQLTEQAQSYLTNVNLFCSTLTGQKPRGGFYSPHPPGTTVGGWVGLYFRDLISNIQPKTFSRI